MEGTSVAPKSLQLSLATKPLASWLHQAMAAQQGRMGWPQSGGRVARRRWDGAPKRSRSCAGRGGTARGGVLAKVTGCPRPARRTYIQSHLCCTASTLFSPRATLWCTHVIDMGSAAAGLAGEVCGLPSLYTMRMQPRPAARFQVHVRVHAEPVVYRAKQLDASGFRVATTALWCKWVGAVRTHGAAPCQGCYCATAAMDSGATMWHRPRPRCFALASWCYLRPGAKAPTQFPRIFGAHWLG